MSNSFTDQPNPYVAPASPFADRAAGVQVGVSLRTIELLRQTRPWVMFLGILGLIGSLLILYASGVTALRFARGPAGRVNHLVFVCAIYLGLSILYVVPSIMLIRFSRRISRLVGDQTTQRLEMALAAQRSFWRFIGILAAVMIAVYIAAILGVGVGVKAAMPAG